MKVKSVSGVVCYVKDVKASVKFYELLGFDFKVNDDVYARGYINWFFIDLVEIGSEGKDEFVTEARTEPKGTGIFLNLSVDDVDAAYRELAKAGYKPSSESRDWDWGTREFVVRDPDGYKIVLFKKK